MATTMTLSRTRSPMIPKSIAADSHSICICGLSVGHSDLHQPLGFLVVDLCPAVGAIGLRHLRLQEQKPTGQVLVGPVVADADIVELRERLLRYRKRGVREPHPADIGEEADRMAVVEEVGERIFKLGRDQIAAVAGEPFVKGSHAPIAGQAHLLARIQVLPRQIRLRPEIGRQREPVCESEHRVEGEVDPRVVAHRVDAHDVQGRLLRIGEIDVAGGKGESGARRQRHPEECPDRIAGDAKGLEIDRPLGEGDPQRVVVQELVAVVPEDIDAVVALPPQRIGQRAADHVSGSGAAEIGVDAAENIGRPVCGDFGAQAVVADRNGIGEPSVLEAAALRQDAEG